jgi:3'-phosphoadenosine 5'-phosphosulfate sulfotransferase (PAPS reductase)/FAD synthetase
MSVTMSDVVNNLDDAKARHIVSVSGGKDSAALAVHLNQNYPQIPVEYVFCDTGCELPETYEYLEKLEALLGAEVKRLNVLDMMGIKRKPGRNPFDVILKQYYGGFLPNPQARWCTRVLKIQPFEHYVGTDKAYSYIGIRADENREGYVGKKPPKISEKPNIIPVYPLKDDGFTLSDVQLTLEQAGLGLPDYYSWRTRSGCYFCFYQQIAEWQGLKENHPHLFEAAKQYEKVENGKTYTWRSSQSLKRIEELKERRSLLKDGEGCAICHL